MTDTTSGLIFISCGLVTAEEKELGHDISNLVRELTPHEPYFAQNQSSLEGFTTNILGKLNRAVGLIAVMHPRGMVQFPDGSKQARASVWIEQEIAIAAFITQALGRELKIAPYFHADIRREGMRDQLQLNELPFRENGEILQRLRELLPSWGDLVPFAETRDPLIDERRERVHAAIARLEKVQQEALRLLLVFGSLTDYTALWKLKEAGLSGSYASVLPGLRNMTGLVRPVPNQATPKQPEYDLTWEVSPDVRPLVEQFFQKLKKIA